MTTHSSILAWEISWSEEPNRLQSMESQSQKRLSMHTHTHPVTVSMPPTLAFHFLKHFQLLLPTCHIWNLLTSYDPAIPFLGIYPDKTIIWKDTCTRMFITALFTEGKKRKHPQFSSVTQLGPTLCNPMDHCTPGLPVHHQLPESTQTHLN